MVLDLLRMADSIRSLALDAIQRSKSGHPGIVSGMADVVTVLFSKFLRFNPEEPDWPDRDRFLLSAGHGSMLLYAVLYLTGYEGITLEDIKNFRQYGANTAGHPEYGMLPGIEATSGPLGQGFGNAVGMAIAESILNARLGRDKINHYTYAIVGDGCLMEGIGYESASLAGHLGLGKLVVLFDDNAISIDGSTDLSCSEDHVAFFHACGWHVQSVDGHSYQEVEDAIANARNNPKPSLIACKTTIGKFMPNQGTSAAHSGSISREAWYEFKNALGIKAIPFHVDSDVLSMWRSLSCCESYERWNSRISDSDRDVIDGKVDLIKVDSELDALKKLDLAGESSRVSSGRVLSVLFKSLGNLVGGSADLSKSNFTLVNGMKVINKSDFRGQYIHYGIREHLMAACMNGIALHKGFIPYGGTFFVFTDYCRPAIRLSALMGLKVIYVATHDSIGVGEDGPTHQPVEHLASLRAMPDIYVVRPAGFIETLEAWQVALKVKGPVILVLSRQMVVDGRAYTAENMLAKGAYVLTDAPSVLHITIFASGSEVGIAIEAMKILHKEHANLGVRIVSVPCWELFFEQSEEYINEIIVNDSLKIAIEAASSFGWERFIGNKGQFIGLDCFGKSAPFTELYSHFKITAEEVVRRCKEYFGL